MPDDDKKTLAKDLKDKLKVAQEFVPNFGAGAYVPGGVPDPSLYFQMTDSGDQYQAPVYGDFAPAPAAGYQNYAYDADVPVKDPNEPDPFAKKKVVVPKFASKGKAKVLSLSGSTVKKVTPTASQSQSESSSKAVSKEDISPAADVKKSPAKVESKSEPKVQAPAVVKEKVQNTVDVKEKEKKFELTPEQKAQEEAFFDLNSKQSISVVFIGHVDAGKSTTGGHILVLTGMVDKRTVEKYAKEAKEQNRESWYLSWALDTDQSERAKGKTVETAKAQFETDQRRYTILDAPGHKNYVPSMISGASQADFAILIISARKGEFETGFEKGGQTREHAMLAKTVGVKYLIVAINKMDDSSVNWSQERYDECVYKLTPFLKQSGWGKNDTFFMPISGFTGDNLKDKVSSTVCPWYDGVSLLDKLDSLESVDRKNDAPFIFPINDKWRDMGVLQVSGKVELGRIRKGKQVVVMPTKKVVEVIGCFNEADEEQMGAVCGDDTRLRLRGVEEEELQVGYVLCQLEASVHACTEFEAQLMIVDLPKVIISKGYCAVMQVQTAQVEIQLDDLLYLVDPKTKRKSKKPPMFVKKGQIVVARVSCSSVVCLEPFDDCPQLGRFTIRDEGKTIAMGKITKLIDPFSNTSEEQVE